MPLRSGESFEAPWPALIWDPKELNWIVDVEASRADGWTQDPNSNWVRKFIDAKRKKITSDYDSC